MVRNGWKGRKRMTMSLENGCVAAGCLNKVINRNTMNTQTVVFWAKKGWDLHDVLFIH